MTALFYLIVVLLFARFCGWAFQRLGQPHVLGELSAGLILGLLGVGQLGASHQWLLLNVGQAGIAIYLFFVGLELPQIRPHIGGRSTLGLIIGTLLFPFSFGILGSFSLLSLAPSDASPLVFSLFLGIAFSATAFPVLIRILDHENLLRKPLGMTAIGIAALNDLASWLGLGLVIALQSGIGISIGTLSSTLLFFSLVAGVLVARWPRVQTFPVARVNSLVGRWWIPLFFASAGLKARFDLAYWPHDFWIALAILFIAVVGKAGGTFLSARLNGEPLDQALALGVLMNTRGLVELVILEFGLRLGILSQRLYTLFVLMAILTTLMTTPLLRVIIKKTKAT